MSNEFKNGDKVRLKAVWDYIADEVFILSQWDGHKGWIGDKQGFGWFIYGNQIEKI